MARAALRRSGALPVFSAPTSAGVARSPMSLRSVQAASRSSATSLSMRFMMALTLATDSGLA